MKKIEYDNTVIQMREVIDLCKAMTQEKAKSYELGSLSAILNQYFPDGCTSTAPDRVAWEAARKHLDTFITAPKKSAWHSNPYVVGIVVGLIIAAVTVFVFQPWQDSKDKNESIQTIGSFNQP